MPGAVAGPQEIGSGAIQASILVVSYCTRELTRSCLSSVQRETLDIPHEVIVVDNASDDGSAAMIAEEFPEVRLLTLNENIGFARGVNLAAERARGQHLILLNPDAVLLEGAVAKLLAFAGDHHGVGIVGGRTFAPDGSLDPRSCRGMPTLWGMTCYGLGLSTLFRGSRIFDPESLGRWERDSVRQVGYVTGCLMLVPRALWERLGGFDPRYFMYSEDVDFAVRAANLGYSAMITPDAAVIHHFGASSSRSGNKTSLMLAGRTTFLFKHWSPLAARYGLAMLWLGVGLRTLGAWVASRLPGRQLSDRARQWPEAWRQRRLWLSGYEP